MLLIYSEIFSTRLTYILQIFFGDKFSVTSDIDFFNQNTNAKINYSNQKIAVNEVYIKPSAILFEQNIVTQTIECFNWQNLKVFFKTEGDIPFDIFAASFYLLSRYEEYLPHQKDFYGRYAHTNSIAFKEDFLQLPLINLWMHEFEKTMRQKFPVSAFTQTTFTFLPTYDIDIAYKNSGFLKKTYLFLKNILKAKPAIGKDAFDTYNWLDELQIKFNLQPLYFFLLAQKKKGYDKNVSPYNKQLQQLIIGVSRKNAIGIHPSWQSGDDEIILIKEIELLCNISKQSIKNSRQHYIKMNLPETYERLIKHSITNDHSMGYGSINGFRASYCLPFFWYDLKNEKQTSLLIHPFCFMEANSFFEQGFNAMQAGEELQQYFDVVKKVNGKLITIFHNHFITEEPQWIEWRKMYEAFLKKNFLAEK